jgi:cystathionine beta-lyase/cystathionine gamma-synthase
MERAGLSGDLAAPELALGADERAEFDEDVVEVQWHINHLRERLCGLGKRSPLRDQARLMEGRLTRIESHLARSRGGDGLLQRHECSLRALYRTSALLQTGAEWHSPPGSLVHPIQDLTALSVLEGYNDYQRGYVEQLREVEEHLAAQLSLPADVKRRTLVFSSGMGAIHTALQLLLGQGARLLVGRRVYYETQALLEQWFHCCRPQLMPLDERQSDQAALTAAIGEADAVFLDTVTLDREGIRLAPERLFDAVRNAQKLGFSIVLDNTVLGWNFRYHRRRRRSLWSSSRAY